MVGLCRGGKAGNVPGPVFSGAQDLGTDDQMDCTSPNAPVVGGRDRRLGNIHVGRFDNGEPVGESLCERLGYFIQEGVALGEPRTVID